MPFLHGVEVVEIDSGVRPIKQVKSSVIGIVGTAPDADPVEFPLNEPVLVTSRGDAAGLDTVGNAEGFLPSAIEGIFDQNAGAIVVVRVEEGVDDLTTQTNIIGGASAGVHALEDAQSDLGVEPRILCCEFSHVLAVGAELESVGETLRATVYVDGPNIDDASAQTYVDNFSSARLKVVDPWVKVGVQGTVEPGSPRAAGLRSRIDNEKGFWHSESNQPIYGIVGIARPIDFRLGDENAKANILNENQVTTIIRENGFRLWGNLSATSDPKWQFLSVRRTADLIQDSLQRAHLWAVDRNITKTYIEDVVEGVNAYLDQLKSLGAILGGECWADPDLNSPTALAAGEVYFDFDFTPPAPAQKVSFRSHMVDDYFEEVV